MYSDNYVYIYIYVICVMRTDLSVEIQQVGTKCFDVASHRLGLFETRLVYVWASNYTPRVVDGMELNFFIFCYLSNIYRVHD